MILVVSYPGEDHTDAVVEELQRHGREVVRLDLADFPTKAAVAATWCHGKPAMLRLESERGCVDISRTKVVWWRRVRPFQVDNRLGSFERRQFAASETSQAINGMLDALGCPWVNPREADSSAHHKPYQWTVAQSVGLKVPRTLVTSQPSAARDFISALAPRRVVFKAFLASIEEWRETRLVEPEDIGRLELVRYAPVIFQEYIEGVDLRITIIGNRLFPAAIDARRSSYPIDMRMVIDQGNMSATAISPEVEQQLLYLQRRLGLVYGAVDMRRTDEGEYYFLEVNPAGQWLFVEKRTGLPITRAHAELLASMAGEPL
jgi:glutathione synthase/RimK-type ligase-like ATP-grasp enzyme